MLVKVRLVTGIAACLVTTSFSMGVLANTTYTLSGNLDYFRGYYQDYEIQFSQSNPVDTAQTLTDPNQEPLADPYPTAYIFSFSLPAPLAPNSTFNLALSWSAVAGTYAWASTLGCDCTFTTGVDGGIVSWNIYSDRAQSSIALGVSAGASLGLYSTPGAPGGAAAGSEVWVTTFANNISAENPNLLRVYKAGFDSERIGVWTITTDTANPASPIPEPETYAMVIAGLGLLGLAARRRKQKVA